MNNPGLETLLFEFREIHQECRDHMSALDKIISTGFTVIGIATSAAIGLHEMRILYLLPSFVFMFSMILIIRTMTLNILATYSSLIEAKIRSMFKPGEILIQWESGDLGFKTREPFSIFGFGVVLSYLPILAGFIVLSYLCYNFWNPSLIIHSGEAIIAVGYAYLCARWSRSAHREMISLKQMKPAEHNVQTAGREPPAA